METNMNITFAKYQQSTLTPNGDDFYNCSILAMIDGVEIGVPLDPANRHYAEIMRQVEAGTLTIAEAV